MHPGFGQSGSSSAKRLFSNDWKNFSRVFQRLEKSFERLVWQRDGNGGHVKGMGLSIHFMNWTGNKMLTLLG
jgi:hypothetical protein